MVIRFEIAGKNPIAKMPRTIVTPIPAPPIPIPLAPSSNDPSTLFDPDIDMIGEITVDADTRKLKFRGLIDGFPFFEGYVTADGGSPVTIFQREPEPGENPLTGLPGPPRRVVEVDIRIPQ